MNHLTKSKLIQKGIHLVTAVEYEYLMVVKEEGEKEKKKQNNLKTFFHLILLCTKDELPRFGVIQIIYFRGKRVYGKPKQLL